MRYCQCCTSDHDNLGKTDGFCSRFFSGKNSSNEFKKFLASLETGVEPNLHINGHHFTTAVVVVDFGTPLRPIKLSSDQTQELFARLRKLTKEVIGKDVHIRVSNEYQHGVFWSSLT